MTLFYRIAITVILSATSAINSFAVEHETTQIKDLRYGEALYNFYQEKYFSSITNLLVAKQQRPITAHALDSELLLGGLYLYYGLHNKASDIFSNLIEKNTSKEVQDRAWFNIGKMYYRQHSYDKAKQALLKIKDALSPEREAERQNMLTNIYLSKNNFIAAKKSIQKLFEHTDWEIYAQYNLAIALIKSGENIEGTRLLNKISNIETDNRELKALKDKIYIALGYAYIRQNKPEISTQHLEKVRLKGPLSAKALLGTGWSYQQQNDFERALVPWMELRNWPVVDTAVQESLLAIPYTLEKMGKNQLALKHYNYAIESYKKELASLGDVINSVKSGELLFALTPSVISENTLFQEHKHTLPNSIAVPYLHHLLNSKDFQKTVKDYLDLIYLKKSLNSWKNQIPAYKLMLRERNNYYRKQLHSTKNDPRLNSIKRFKEKRDQLEIKINKIEQQHNIFALATSEEKENLHSLNKIKNTLQKLEQQDDFSEENEKYELLQGLLLWDISTDYSPRLWKVNNELNQLNKALSVASKRLQSLKKSSAKAPLAFSGFKERIASNENNLNKLLNKISRIIFSQEKHIEKQALTSLKQRYHQVENYHIRARYSLAHLYDRITLPNNIGSSSTANDEKKSK